MGAHPSRKPIYKLHAGQEMRRCVACGEIFHAGTDRRGDKCRECRRAAKEPQAQFRLMPAVRDLRRGDVVALNDDDTYDAFKMLRWGWNDGRPECQCGHATIYEYRGRRIFKCAKCERQFSITSNTLFHARKLPHRAILTALATTLHDPVNAHALSLDMEINYRTAQRLLSSFRIFAGNIEPKTRETGWPYLAGPPANDMEKLFVRVANTIPRGLPEQVRADVGQELIVGLLSGDFTEEMLGKQLRRYIRKHYKENEFNQFRDVSFNQPIPGESGARWEDVISTQQEGRIDAQSEWARCRAEEDQVHTVYKNEVLQFAGERLWTFDEAEEFLEADE